MGVGFVGFGQTSKKLLLFEKSGPSCFTEEKNSYGLGSNVLIRRLIDNLIILSY